MNTNGTRSIVLRSWQRLSGFRLCWPDKCSPEQRHPTGHKDSCVVWSKTQPSGHLRRVLEAGCAGVKVVMGVLLLRDGLLIPRQHPQQDHQGPAESSPDCSWQMVYRVCHLITNPSGWLVSWPPPLAMFNGPPRLTSTNAASTPAAESMAEAASPKQQMAALEEELLRTESMLAAEKQGEAGLDLFMKGSFRSGLKALKAAAVRGDAASMHNLAVILEHGYGPVRKNLSAAMKWYSKAADRQYAASMYNLGLFNERGLAGLQPDPQRATYWYRRAAQLGLTEAQALFPEEKWDEECCWCRQLKWQPPEQVEEEGRECKVAPTEEHLQQGRELFQLAQAYHYGGTGVPEDKHLAVELYDLAAKKGFLPSTTPFWTLFRELYYRRSSGSQTSMSSSSSYPHLQLTAHASGHAASFSRCFSFRSLASHA